MRHFAGEASSSWKWISYGPSNTLAVFGSGRVTSTYQPVSGWGCTLRKVLSGVASAAMALASWIMLGCGIWVPSWVRNSYMPMTEDIAVSTFARCEAESLVGHGRV